MKAIAFFVMLSIFGASASFDSNDNPWEKSPFQKASDAKVPKKDSVESAAPKASKWERYFTDKRDGRKYEIAVINKKAWMAENLRYRSPDSECFNGEELNCKEEGGRFYTWASAMGVESKCNISECKLLAKPYIRGVCPEGWHIPSDAEWKEMLYYVKSKAGSLATRALKSTYGWKRENGTNESHFNIYPSGFRFMSGNFLDRGVTAKFWSTSQLNARSARSYVLREYYRDTSYMYPDEEYKENELNVRCVADE